MDKYLSDKIKVISFISIILVVFLHSYNLDLKQNGILISFEKSYVWFFENFVSYGFTRIAVPMFFIISGYLFFLNHESKKESFVFKIKKRITSLVIPYFFWSLFGILFYFILQSIPQLQSFFNKGLIKNYSINEWLTTVFINPIPYQLWFIRDLFLIVCLSPLLHFGIRFFKNVLLSLFFVLWFFNFETFHNSFEALLFFYIGSVFSLTTLKHSLKRGKWVTVYVFLAWVFLIFIKVTFDFYNLPSLMSLLILKISILFGLVFSWYAYDDLSTRIPSSINFLLRYSTYTFFIYVSHEPILTICKKVFFVFLGKNEINYLQVFMLAPMCTILISIGISIFLKNNLNYLYRIITGGR